MEKKIQVPVSIRVILGREFCEKLVQSVCLTVGCNCLITDENGIVIASDNPDRVGSFHEGSLDVIASGKTEYHDQTASVKLSGTLPGMTIPLILEENVIGTIGITGSPQEVSRYAELMQQMSQVFMTFQNRQRNSAQLDSRKQSLLRDIITYDKNSRSEDICAIGAELGYNLQERRAAVVVRSSADSAHFQSLSAASVRIGTVLAQIFPGAGEFLCAQNDTEWIALLRLTENAEGPQSLLEACRRLESELRNSGLSVCIGIGCAADSPEELRHSYDDACFAIRVMQAGVRCDSCLCADTLLLEKLAAALPEELCARAEQAELSRILEAPKGRDVLDLIDHWCRGRFHFTNTAEAMHIHKSTLAYRFQRIREVYGLDLYDTERVLAIFLLDIRRRLM